MSVTITTIITAATIAVKIHIPEPLDSFVSAVESPAAVTPAFGAVVGFVSAVVCGTAVVGAVAAGAVVPALVTLFGVLFCTGEFGSAKFPNDCVTCAEVVVCDCEPPFRIPSSKDE